MPRAYQQGYSGYNNEAELDDSHEITATLADSATSTASLDTFGMVRL